MDLETNPGKTISKTTPLGWLLATAFLAATLAAAVRSFFHPGDSAVCAMDATSLLTGTAFFLHGSTRQLPFQNLLAAFVFVYLSFWIPALLGLLPAFPLAHSPAVS